MCEPALARYVMHCVLKRLDVPAVVLIVHTKRAGRESEKEEKCASRMHLRTWLLAPTRPPRPTAAAAVERAFFSFRPSSILLRQFHFFLFYMGGKKQLISLLFLASSYFSALIIDGTKENLTRIQF